MGGSEGERYLPPSVMTDLLHAGMHWQILNFIIFVGLLFYFLRRPVREFWTGRTSRMRSEMDEAGRLRVDSARRHDDLKRRASQIEKEVKDLIRSLEEEGELEKKRMVEDAEKLSTRIKADTERVAEQEMRKAKETLKAEAVRLAVELAERLVRENIRDGDQKRISENYLSSLESE